MSHVHDSSDSMVRHSRYVTGAKPVFFFFLAIGCAIGHHIINTLLSGQPIDTLNLDRFEIKVFDHSFPLKNLSQKQQHWVLNVFAFFFKSFVVRAMSYGLSQHAWKALRTTELTVLQIDRVIALQHRKLSGLRSFTVWCSCPGFVLYGIIAMIVPYAAIFPSGSLTVVQLNGEAVYAYNPDWLKWPYTGTLIVTFLCIVLGTSHLFSHNKTNLSFAFSHILSATRNAGFDDVLSAANRHHVPAKLLEQVGTIKFGILRDSGREAFARVEDLMSPEETQEEQGKEEAGCFGWAC